MSIVKPIYKTFRSIIITLILLALVVYIGLYILLSLPSVQNKVKNIACGELSSLLGGRLEIDRLSISPFSEVLLNDVVLKSPEGEVCASIRKVAGGIDLGSLIFERRIVLNYAEIIGLDACISKADKDGPVNIQFLIDALSPKDKTKPPAHFDLRFRNIIVRDSKALLSRKWLKEDSGQNAKFSEVSVDNLRLDLSIPVLKNDEYRFDIRNLQCDITPGFNLRGLSAEILFKKDTDGSGGDNLIVRDLNINLPHTALSAGDLNIKIGSGEAINAILKGHFTPSDLSQIVPALKDLNSVFNLDIDADISKNYLTVNSFELGYAPDGSYIRMSGDASGFQSKDNLSIHLDEFKADLSSSLITGIAGIAGPIKPKVDELLSNIGDVKIGLRGILNDSDNAEVVGNLSTDLGIIDISGFISNLKTSKPQLSVSLIVDKLELGQLLSTSEVGETSFSLDADITGLDKNAEGEVTLASDYLYIRNTKVSLIDCNLQKSGNEILASLKTDDDNLRLNLEAGSIVDGANSLVNASIKLDNLNTNLAGLKGKLADSNLQFNLDVHSNGNSIDNINGLLYLSNLRLTNSAGNSLYLKSLSLIADTISNYQYDLEPSRARSIRLKSDWVDADITGHLYPHSIANEMKRILASVFPSLLLSDKELISTPHASNDFTYDIDIKGATDLYDYFSLPVAPLTDIPVKGRINTPDGKFDLSLSTPHIRQGRDKLIRDTSLKISLDSFLQMAKIDASTIFPAKKGDVQLVLDMSGIHDKLVTNILLNPTFQSSLKGGITLESNFSSVPDPISHKPEFAAHVDIIPSVVTMKDTKWSISDGSVDYFGKTISVKNFLIRHDNQYVKIDGVASENANDFLSVKLNDIDLDYIFGMLNINYVTFGGMATGEVIGSRLLTKTPVAHTKFLRVKDLSYNGAVLGDGDLASTFYPEELKVGIYALIKDPLTRQRRANIDGGIWIGRDSLSFDFDANKVNLQIMKPFVSAFCSDIRGQGSGRCKLYGTFSDIDLVGNLKADTISMKIDFTNTWYHAGGDSVFMKKGLIDIRPLTLYDSYGHTAELSGWLRHRYFHEPEFNFKIRNAKSILCYDTNEKLNPLWYGTIFASGSGQIAGRPGIVEIDMNMTTRENSRFYYVISDTEETDSYSFLSFTDRRKEEREAQILDTIPEYLHKFMKKKSEEEEGRSNVILSLKGSVTNDALVTLIMDPIAGDKITARGQGALQMDYNMDANDVRMIGTYTLDEGSYYFTLQDIIIKNFIIKQGSRIKFDGDPLDADLDITATYRVNTNLTDLDKSFSTDKELNRTNVPVDAILMVDGPMTHPDIEFDIELPTLTSDVERKVKSIISTNDMMSRQIIYLLALNRFYTPEYTGSSSSGGAEMSSVASSTLSSQLSNILSNMTDKLDISPSFRSDNGKFNDMEFDLALSSRLLNNRLLINGNFGYRDRQTSNTQFVGDFDIEYLLNKNGNLRLKAYNHFNDQNYYLRSALTTQGVGIVFRRDFDHLFNFRKKEKSNQGDSLLLKNKERKDSTFQNQQTITGSQDSIKIRQQ